MKKLFKILAGIAIFFAILAIFIIYQYGPNFNIYIFPPSAERYGEIALDRMNNGLYAHGENWAAAKEKATDQFQSAEEYEDTYPIIEEALQVAGGDHSFIVPPNEQETGGANTVMPTTAVEDSILILTLPAFASADQAENQAYADSLNDALHNEDYQGVIIDLADNTGGDMGPMVAGLSSLIPDGPVVKFQYANDIDYDSTLEQGSLTGGGTSVTVSNAEKISDIPIAVITNNLTASSGEVTALAFKGLDNVQFFGKKTYGLTSANTPVELYNGLIMQLTTAKLIDRTGTTYENVPIEPDVETNSPKEDAIEWLKNQ